MEFIFLEKGTKVSHPVYGNGVVYDYITGSITDFELSYPIRCKFEKDPSYQYRKFNFNGEEFGTSHILTLGHK